MTTGRINQITIFASSCCREYAYTRVYSGPAAPFTPSHTTPTTADEKNNQKHEHGRRAQLKARFKNPCKRFFFIFSFLIQKRIKPPRHSRPANAHRQTQQSETTGERRSIFHLQTRHPLRGVSHSRHKAISLLFTIFR